MPPREALGALEAPLLGTASLNLEETLAAIRRRERPIADVVSDALAIIDQAETFGAIAWRCDDDARATGTAADARLASGGAIRPLEGIPFTVKELLPVEGRTWDQGSAVFAGLRAPATATLVRRLEAAGAILVAGTASAELGALATTENVRGACSNPADPTRTSGGSSGGAAVCAALGLPLNHGSDGGGSVRIPAACCGVVGVKPSRGRVTSGPLSGDGWGGLSVNGALTSTVADAARFLDAVCGRAHDDPCQMPPPDRPFLEAARSSKRLRVAVAFARPGLAVDASAVAATRRAADMLAAAGHHVVEAAPNLDPLEEGFGVISQVGIGSTPVPPDRLVDLLPRTRELWQQAQSVNATVLMRALESVAIYSRVVDAFFAQHDVLLTPTLSGPAPLLGTLGADPETAWDDYRVFLQWTWPFNATGQPAISVPFGDTGGLPLGVQVVARKGEDWTALAIAAELERLR